MSEIRKNPVQYFFVSILVLFCLFFSWKIYTVSNLSSNDQHFVMLAKSLLEKRLDLVPETKGFPYGDIALFKGKYYLYFGPLPALLLTIPVSIWGVNFSQHILTILVALFSFYLVFRIAQKLGYNQIDSLWIATFWVWGTIYSFLCLVNISAFQAQAIAPLFVFLAINEFYFKKRYFLIGLYLSLAMATRQTIALSVIFFILNIFCDKNSIEAKFVKLFHIILPLFITLGILCLYNFCRFGSFWESGYSYNITLPYSANYPAAQKYGLFSFRHIPHNIYYFLFRGPELIKDSSYLPKFPFLRADEWGLSIIYTSPLLLLPFFFMPISLFWKEIISILAIAIPNFTYYGIGYAQYGYRYALDFYPFLLLILLRFLKGKLELSHKALIAYSVLFNLIFMLSIWGKYPLFGI